MDLKKAFGKALRDFRGTEGMSQEALAFEADLDRTYISLLERGIRQPSLGTIFSLSKALSCKASDLVAATEKLQKR
jgi:transcriptional regulator with XRE-family HTH domain